jgi:hypothetical protein
MAAIAAVTLGHSPPRVLRANGTGTSGPLISTARDLSVCQTGETLPANVSAIRLSMWAFLGWKINVKLYSGKQVVTEGSRGPDWTGTSVTVPVKPVAQPIRGATLCFMTGPNSEPELLLGGPAPEKQVAALLEPGVPAPEASLLGRLPGRLSAEYLSSGEASWWSRIGTVATHMGLGRAFTGSWIALLVAALMLAVAVLTVRLTLREIS